MMGAGGANGLPRTLGRGRWAGLTGDPSAAFRYRSSIVLTVQHYSTVCYTVIRNVLRIV